MKKRKIWNYFLWGTFWWNWMSKNTVGRLVPNKICRPVPWRLLFGLNGFYWWIRKGLRWLSSTDTVPWIFWGVISKDNTTHLLIVLLEGNKQTNSLLFSEVSKNLTNIKIYFIWRLLVAKQSLFLKGVYR